jgi:hypothetical protein
MGTPASYHPSSNHWGLWDLQRWHNRLYLAHGDWINNTGPVHLLYLDLATGEIVHDEQFVADEEALEIVRLYDDTLYIPGIDATEGWEYGNLYLKSWGEPWLKRRSIPDAVHVWDIACLGETLLAVGRIQVDNLAFGAVWTSTDKGESWQQGPDLRAGGYGEATSLFVLGDRVYVTTVGTGCLAFDGSNWEEADCVPSSLFEPGAHVHKNALFGEVVVMAPYRCVDDTHLHFFDGTRRWAVDLGEPVRDVVSTDSGLFILSGFPSGRGTIFYAKSLACRCDQDVVRLVSLDWAEEGPPAVEDEVSGCSLGHPPIPWKLSKVAFT